MYSPFVNDDMFVYNIIFSRFINYPRTLESVGYFVDHDPDWLEAALAELATLGKVWGGAYVITTHGVPMAKHTYLVRNVLEGAYNALGPRGSATRAKLAGSCQGAYTALQGLEGLGSFLAAQVVADLKNTPGNPLCSAMDRLTFVAHGPGSIRGLQWFWSEPKITATSFQRWFAPLRVYVDENWDRVTMGEPIDNQDLQNCLCEFDKYMRVSTGTGRSKRKYQGF